MRTLLRGGSFLLLACLIPSLALAQQPPPPAVLCTLTFTNCSGDASSPPVQTELAQMFVDVISQVNSGQVLFNVRNTGAVDFPMTHVYFDDGSLLGIASLIDADEGTGGDAGVDFSQGASPPDLAGGNQCPGGTFNVTAGFLADADTPMPNVKAINKGEKLGILFNLQGGKTVNDVLNEFFTGALRVGIQASQTYVNGPGQCAPSENPDIDIEKKTNGSDADTAPGPTITVGDAVTWTYEVENTGDVTLTGVSVTDDQLGAITCPTSTLNPGDSMTCTANGTAQLGQYANEGTAEGTSPQGTTVDDTDPSHYFGVDAPPTDDTKPLCEIASVTRTQLVVDTQDGGSGLDQIQVTRARNLTVTIPGFTPGTNALVQVVATKINSNKRASLALRVIDVAGNVTECDPVVATVGAEVPEAFELGQNYPNPFNPTTMIPFGLAEAAPVHLAVYDVLGRAVTVLVDEVMEAGRYEAAWNGRSAQGQLMPSGVYLYRIQAGDFVAVKRLTLTK